MEYAGYVDCIEYKEYAEFSHVLFLLRVLLLKFIIGFTSVN